MVVCLSERKPPNVTTPETTRALPQLPEGPDSRPSRPQIPVGRPRLPVPQDDDDDGLPRTSKDDDGLLVVILRRLWQTQVSRCISLQE